jgi:hypothetical protein
MKMMTTTNHEKRTGDEGDDPRRNDNANDSMEFCRCEEVRWHRVAEGQFDSYLAYLDIQGL